MSGQPEIPEMAAQVAEWYGLQYAAHLVGATPRTFSRWTTGERVPLAEPLYRLEGLHEAGRILTTTIPADEVTHWLGRVYPEFDRTLHQLLADPTALYSRYWRSQVADHTRTLARIAAREQGTLARPRASASPEMTAATRLLELLRDDPPASGIRYRHDRLLLQVKVAIDHARAVASARGEDFPDTARAIGQGLVQLGLVEPSTSGKTQTVARIDGQAVRVWDLPSDAI